MTGPSPIRIAVAAVMVLMVGACASGPESYSATIGRVPDPGVVITYPVPPQQPRVQFFAAITSQGDLRGEEGGSRVVKPYGLDIGGGKIYVCDLDLGGVSILDLRSRDLDRFLPRGQGRLESPVNCTRDPENGDLYVVDSSRSDVTVFDSTLTYVDNIMQEGGRPGDVFVDGDTLWVSDMERHRVDVYVKDSRTFVRSIGMGAPGTPEAVTQPTNIWVTDDYVYVSDFGTFSESRLNNNRADII